MISRHRPRGLIFRLLTLFDRRDYVPIPPADVWTFDSGSMRFDAIVYTFDGTKP